MIHRKRKFGFLLLLILFILSACGSSGLTNDGHDVSSQDWFVEDFSAINQHGEPLRLVDLEEEVWLASFIFTNCTSVCPPMTANMVKIQERLLEKELQTPIVSFSVDPERDTPEVLLNYADQFGADVETWDFITGYTYEEIKELSEGSFKSPLEKPTDGSDQFAHGVYFYLLKGKQIVKFYNGASDTPYDSIVTDVEVLTKEMSS